MQICINLSTCYGLVLRNPLLCIHNFRARELASRCPQMVTFLPNRGWTLTATPTRNTLQTWLRTLVFILSPSRPSFLLRSNEKHSLNAVSLGLASLLVFPLIAQPFLSRLSATLDIVSQRGNQKKQKENEISSLYCCSRSSFRVVLLTLLFPVHFFPCTSWYLTDIGQLNLFNEETGTYRLVKQNVISEVLIVGLACKLLRQFAFRGCSPLDRVLYTAYTFGAISTPKAYESYLSMYLGLYPSLKMYQRQRRQ